MPKLLPFKVFLESFKYAPRLAISLVVENKKGEILLTRRSVPPKSKFWHVPGGFVLKDEPLAECLKRIARKELGLAVDPKKALFVGVFENLKKDPRGHVVELVYKVKASKPPRPTEETREVRFFRKLPSSPVGFGQGEILKTLGYK